MRTIKCKYCGKSYASPSEMRTRKCHSHPNGAWGGHCTPSSSDLTGWKIAHFHDDQLKWYAELKDAKQKIDQIEKREAEFRRMYKQHTPLLDCVLKGLYDEPSEHDPGLQMQSSRWNEFAVELANGINNETLDAINTIYALRAGCDYVLNNADAQKEGSLGSWLDEIRQLKDEVTSWDFWVDLYWLTKPLTNKDLAAYASVFHTNQVLPMLRALSKNGDEKDKEVMDDIKSYIAQLRIEKSWDDAFDPKQLRCIETLSRKINDYSFWGVLYCLYWIELRPTPWDDQKVWPIQTSQKDAKTQELRKCPICQESLQRSHGENGETRDEN